MNLQDDIMANSFNIYRGRWEHEHVCQLRQASLALCFWFSCMCLELPVPGSNGDELSCKLLSSLFGQIVPGATLQCICTQHHREHEEGFTTGAHYRVFDSCFS